MQLNTYLFVIGSQATMLIAEEVQKVSKNNTVMLRVTFKFYSKTI